MDCLIGFLLLALFAAGGLWLIVKMHQSVYNFMVCDKCRSKKMTFVKCGVKRPHYKPELARREMTAWYAQYACLGCDKDLFFPENWFPPADM